MATTHTLTGNVYDLTGATFGATGLRVVVVTNLGAKDALVDKTTNSIHLGGKQADLNASTGEFSVDLIDTSATDLNVAAGTLEYEVRVEYVNPATRVRSTWTSGWFPFTADANLADITTDVEPLAVESASGYALEAKGYRDETATISGLTGEDAAVAFLVGDEGSETATALSATIAAQAGPAGLAALGLRASIDAGVTTGIALIGDSTGNDDNEWAREMVEALAAEHPEYTVQEALWSDTAQDAAPPTVIQTGTAGIQYLDTSTSVVCRQVPLAESPHTSGVLDVRAKVRLPNWTAPATSTVLVARNGNAPDRSWWFYVNAGNGKLALSYSTDGTALLTKASTDSLTTANNTTQWVRVVYTPSTDVKFYTSADGVTWTQLGATVALAEGAVHDASTPYEMGGRGGSTAGTSHIFEVDIRDGLDGKPLVPRLPSLWGAPQRVHAQVVGAPTLTLVNGSQPGADLAYWTTARIEKALPKFGQALAFLSLSHNELDWSGPNFIGRYASKVTDVKASLVGVPLIYLTQNPQVSPRSAAFIAAQAIRRSDVIKAATKAGDPVIDTYAEFVRVGAATTIQSDGIHPTAAGSLLWRDTVRAATGV